jgi:predicted 3-demethylubiquinone-9 3-methyltransferase (glyoxalase superfamily)
MVTCIDLSNQQPDKEGRVMFSDFMLENNSQRRTAREHKFNFNESVSFIVSGNTQKKLIITGKTLGDSGS